MRFILTLSKWHQPNVIRVQHTAEHIVDINYVLSATGGRREDRLLRYNRRDRPPPNMPVRALTRRFLRARKFLIASFLLLNLLDVLYVRRNLQQAHYDLSYKHERIFIASTHWNDEVILRTHWMTALLQLTKALDPLHVYLSIYESGSYDNTKGALRELDAAMEAAGVFRTVVLDEATHEGEIVKVPPTEEEGWIRMPNGTLGLRRIPYLSRSRNQSLKPFYKLAAAGQKFDKILFLNDVVFTVRTLPCPSRTRYALCPEHHGNRRRTFSRY